MNISPDVWAALRRAALVDNKPIFEHLILAVLEEQRRQDRVRQAANLPIDTPYLYSQR